MKASELDKGLQVLDPSSTDEEERSYYIHPQRIPIYEAFQKVNQSFERSISDRTWDWWITIVTADPVSGQEIKKVVPQIYRGKDQATGSEYLFYNVELYGND